MPNDNGPKKVAGGGQQQSREMRMARSAQEGVEDLRKRLQLLESKVKALEEAKEPKAKRG